MFWIVRAIGSVQPDIPFGERGELKPCFYGEWWRPKNIQENPTDKVCYAKCFSNTQSWERDPRYFNKCEWHEP